MCKSMLRITVVLMSSIMLLSALLFTLTSSIQSAPMISADYGAVVINEVAWMGTAAGTAHEWIELYNTTDQEINLSGWRIEADDGTPNILLTRSIAPHGYYLLERTSDNTISDILADQIYTGALGDGGELLRLKDTAEAIIDTANGAGGPWPAGTTTTRSTMERINPYAPDADDNWATNNGIIRNGLDANGNPLNGTPRTQNSATSADVQVAKTGTPHAAPDNTLWYTLSVRNTGNLLATSVILTDRLPLSVTYAWQSSPYTLTQPDSHTLVWEIGDLTPENEPVLISIYVTVAQGSWVGSITNTITATTATMDSDPSNNTAQHVTHIHPPAVQLTAHKFGPARLYHEQEITYTLTITNIGQIPAEHIVVTDTLVPGMELYSYTGPYTLTQVTPDMLRWEIGALEADNGAATLTYIAWATPATLPGTHTQTMTVTENSGATANTLWSGQVLPYVRLYAVHPANHQGSQESIALINLGTHETDLSGWCLDDVFNSATRTCFPENAPIAPGAKIWLTQNANGFAPLWGFEPDYGDASNPRAGVIPLIGGWPGYTDAGEAVYLLDASNTLIDALAYGSGTPGPGWIGETVPFPYAGYNNLAQVIYRKLDQITGLPIRDTDRASDWAQDANDPFNGRKLRYPGWDLEALFFPLEITHTANITIAVAPEGMLNFVSQTVASAQQSIIIQGYSMESIPLYETLAARIQAGVVITTLLERVPAGGMSDAQKWVMQQLHQPPLSQVYLIGGPAGRYRFQHAKFMIIDDRLALISTDNFNESSMPSDWIDDGTYGHRGFVMLTDDPHVIARLKQIFDLDCDPENHMDIIPYDSNFAPPASYTPLPPLDWTYYPPIFRDPLGTTATHITVMQSPEHTLRNTDGLLALLGRTGPGDTVRTMQMSEAYTWTTGVGEIGLNPRIQALVAAARRGATVQVLYDRYYDDAENPRSNTVTCLALNALARKEGISITCRMANVTGLGIHAKLFLVQLGDEAWINLSSVNGSENSNKVNRELMLQFESVGAHTYLREVFEHDWALGSGPLIFKIYLPLVMHKYTAPPNYPVITEVFINPPNPDGAPETGSEWIEIYNPAKDTFDLSDWSIGDAINEGDYGDGRYYFPPEAQLLPGQIIIIAGCASEFAATYGFNPAYEWLGCDPLVPDLIPTSAWEGFGMALGNTTDEVILSNAFDVHVDTVAWGGDFRIGILPFVDYEAPFPTNASLERSPANSDTDDCAADFRIRYTPRPGQVWTP